MNHLPQTTIPAPQAVPVIDERALARMTDTGRQIASIIEECLPATTGTTVDFIGSLVIAKGVHDLKAIFLQSPEIRQVVMSMCNNRLGFLTDRTPSIVARNQRSGKYPNKLYSFEDLVDPLIEGLLKGYRINNNEINIISGQFYAAKSGNYRMILEYPSLSNFVYNNAPATYANDKKSARVKVWATWKLSDTAQSIGVEPNDELVLAIRVNYGMGDDAVLGKAHAKLFKRVLERLSGQVVPESSDVDLVTGGGQAIPRAEIPATPESMVDDTRPPLDLYGNADDAQPRVDEEDPGTKTEFVRMVRREVGEEFLADTLADVKTRSADQGLTEKQFMLKMLKFHQEREEWISQLAGILLSKPDGDNGNGAADSPAPDSPAPGNHQDNFWTHKPNWINRRGAPFLMLVRIGLGLPFVTGALAKKDGDSIEVTTASVSTYDTEKKKYPEAWGSLLNAHPSVQECVSKKMAEKRSMGLVDGIFDQWLSEAKGGDRPLSQPPENGPDTQDTTEGDPATSTN